MDQWKWYYSSLGRIESEKILKNRKNGEYLIRQSETTADHVLSICWDGHAHHYKIRRSPKGLHLNTAAGVEQIYFDTFDKLVAYYTVPDRGLLYTLTDAVCRDTVAIGRVDNAEDEEESEEESDYDEEDPITPFFLQRLDILTGIKKDNTLKKYLSNYVHKGVNKDFQRVKTGSENPPMFQELLLHAADDLKESLLKFSTRLKIIHELFDVGSNTKTGGNDDFKDLSTEHEDFESLMKMLSGTKSNILKLEEKVCSVLKEYSGQKTDSYDLEKTSPEKSTTEREYSVLTYEGKSPKLVAITSGDTSQKIFEVTSGALKNKSFIALDVKKGTMVFLKNQTDPLESGVVYNSDQVFQLVKSKSSKVKLEIFLENTSVKNYNFENYRFRELFCSTVQQIKIAHKKDHSSSKQLSVFIGSWNMGDAAADDIIEWFRCSGSGKPKVHELSHIPEDVYAIGTQESSYHEKDWTNRLRNNLKQIFSREFKLVTSYSMWGIRIVIFVKAELYNLINQLKQSSVKTGIANTLGNKGAVGVSFNIASTSFCFINCHLTSGNEKLLRRNQNFHSILKGLNVGQGDTFDLTLSFHHLFWFGDLNYRIDLEVTDIIKMIMEKDWQRLFAADQLCSEMNKGNAFINFKEEDLNFPPTYRYTRGTRSTYCWTKVKRTGTRINVPSWCDRVLWRSYPHLTSCNKTYGCTDNICSSDHSPVFATFDVGVVSQSLRQDNQEHKTGCDITGTCVKIVLKGINAKEKDTSQDVDVKNQILTSSMTKFVLEFHSSCFEHTVTSKRNSCDDINHKQESMFRGSHADRSYSYPWWTSNDLVDLVPVLSDPYYLENQHILVAVKAEEGQESYGECVISIRPLLFGKEKVIERPITHFGVSTGVLTLKCQMIIPNDYNYSPSSPNEKIYDLIRVEDELVNGEFSDRIITLEERHFRVQHSEMSFLQDNRHSKLLPDMNKKERTTIMIPQNKDKLIDRSSIQQVEPVNKVIKSPHLTTDDKNKNLGFDNPVLKLQKPQAERCKSQPNVLYTIDKEAPVLPPKKKVVSPRTSVGSSEDDSIELPVRGSLNQIGNFDRKPNAPMSSQSLPRFSSNKAALFSKYDLKHNPSELAYVPIDSTHHATTTDASPPPVAKPRTKKKSSKFMEWLSYHGVDDYYGVLVANGFDDLDYFCSITDDDLRSIGIECDADRKKILIEAKKLSPSKRSLVPV